MASARTELPAAGACGEREREGESEAGASCGCRNSLPVTFHVDANNSMRSLRRHMTLKAYTLYKKRKREVGCVQELFEFIDNQALMEVKT